MYRAEQHLHNKSMLQYLITSKGLALIGHDINDDSMMNSAVQFMYNNNNNNNNIFS